MNEVLEALVSVANHLAEIQIEGVQDLKGFSNADKTFGAHLANVVATDPSDVDAIGALASLCGIKYQGQVGAIVGDKMLMEFKKLAKGVKITPEQRAAAKNTVVAQEDIHEKFGARFLLMFPFNEAFSWALKDLGCKPFHGPDGFKWVVPVEKGFEAFSVLKARGAKIIGARIDKGIINASKPAKVQRTTKIGAKVSGRRIFLAFDYNANIIAVLRTIPGREYDGETRAWSVPKFRAAELLQALQPVPNVDLSEVEAVASSVHPAARAVEVEETPVLVNFERFEKLRNYQRTGVEFMTQPMKDVRSQLDAGVRGFILGDDMGLGKTLQSIIAADAVAEENGRILVVCPATLKLNWMKEIKQWTGSDSIHVIENAECEVCKHGGAFHAAGACLRKVDEEGNAVNKLTRVVEVDGKEVEVDVKWHYCQCTEPMHGSVDKTKRWNIVNYDLLDTHYDIIEAAEFDVMIVDEAHYAKNRESARSRFIVGGNVVMANQPTARDERDKAPRRVDGLAAHVQKRIFVLTGTPLTSRPRDLFNLLRAVGHPLGKNFKAFAMRYCDPQVSIGKNGRQFGTTFNGASNIDELREKVAPILMQRKKEDYLHELPGMQRNWLPVEVDLKRYREIMAEYEARREAGELKSTGDHLAIMTEARVCVANAKVTRTIEIAESKVEQGAKVIIFSVYARVVDDIKKHFGDRAIVIDGKMSTKQKDAAVERFQTDDSLQVLVGNYMNGQGAAVGLNITAASQVIFNDLDWVPANIAQAWCRAYRMGQKRFVEVTFLLAAGTFDEDMAVLLEEKFEVVNAFEGVSGNLFPDLVARLQEAPQNAEARELFEARMNAGGQRAPKAAA